MPEMLMSARPLRAQAQARGTRALPPEGDFVAVSDVWLILWHRRAFIAATVGLLVTAALLYSLFAPSLYSASAQILIDPRGRQVVTNDINPTALSPDGGLTQVESQVNVVQSTTVLVRAIRATGLAQDSEFNGTGLFGFLTRILPPSSPPPNGASISQAEIKTLAALRNRLAVKRAEKVLVIDVVVTAGDPDKAARIANAIADGYLEEQAEARGQAAREASNALTARLSEQRRRVDMAETAVERYRVENNLTVAAGRLVSEQQLSEIGAQLLGAQARTSTLKAQIDQIARERRSGARAGSTAEALQSATIAKLREQEGLLVQREGEIDLQYGDLHPTKAGVKAQLVRTRRAIAAEIDRIERSVSTEYERAQSNERLLQAKLDESRRQTQSSDQASVRLRDLQRDLEAVRSVYANFLLRAQETREQADVDSSNARVISRALPPLKKSWPQPLLLLAGALSGGLGLAAGAALLLGYLRPTLLSQRQVETLAGAKVVGLLPPERRQRKGRGGEQEGADNETRSLADLALFRLRDLGPGDSQGWGTSVLLTSGPEDAAERVRVGRLLAEAAAERGESVLLVEADADARTASEGPGLLDVLSGEISLQQAVRRDQGSGVTLMSRGRVPSNGEADRRGFAAEFIDEAERRFNLVIVDAGSLPGNRRIASLVRIVGSVVLVVELGRTLRDRTATVVDAVSVMGRDVDAALLVDGTGSSKA